MKRIIYIIMAVGIISLSSCGIFKKDCGCPHFSQAKSPKLSPAGKLPA